MTARLKFALAAILLLSATFAFASPQETAGKSSWTPPPARKAKTIFSAKPFAGDNIFKGEAEVWLADAIQKLEGGVFTQLDDKIITEYVTKIGNHLVAHSVAPTKRYQFIVTKDGRMDALTIGGGRIYISQGMLLELKNEDELAGVLAHEIAHDAFSHIAKTVTRQMFWLTGTRKVTTSASVEAALAKLLKEYEKKPFASIVERVMGFCRFDELEADRAAFYNIYKAGYNPRAYESFLKRQDEEQKESMEMGDYSIDQILTLLFGSHPPTPQRVLALSWESNFLKMPPKNSHHPSTAFDEMKSRVRLVS
jgi:predicted Zn-dependent protease